MDEHIIEGLGKARVVVRDGKVVEVGEPNLGYCPIFDKHRGIKKVDKDVIAQNIQFRINDFGMCTPGRSLRMKDFLSFGVSEIICTRSSRSMSRLQFWYAKDAALSIVTDPEMVQGIGGRVSGLVSTTPIPEIIERVEPGNVLDPATARIDQIRQHGKGYCHGLQEHCRVNNKRQHR